MDYRRLGNSGIKVAPLWLGTMMFGDRTDDAAAGNIIAAARDAGVNCIDTADGYAKGESERLVGKHIARDRHRWIVATKLAVPASADPNERGLSRRWMIRACDESLGRLGTDYIDIYYFHREDEDTPIEETVDALGRLHAAGKIRYSGVSNHRAWRIARLVEACRRAGVPAPIVCQPYYNAMNRQPEVEVLPCCGHYGLGVVPYSPLARGVLTGKYPPGAPPPEGTRAGRKDARMLQTEFRRESLEAAQTIKAHAEARGMTPGQFAVLWLLANRLVTSVLAGPRTLDQWREYLGALAHRFTAEDEALVDRLVPIGHPSTPGYHDPQYPIEGRVVATAQS
ncbi:MAG: aldo/keto reductase [Rhodospirillaceae bacterium]|nr:aldo/keto reductase [Rhodospirillaceae bacterium]